MTSMIKEKRSAEATASDQTKRARQDIEWLKVFLLATLHVAGIYGLILCFTRAKMTTVFSLLPLHLISGIGITAGAHRLFCHKSYKARAPLKVFLLIAQSMGFQFSAYYWAKEHRVHHKFSDTDADPSNAKRGFFFAHIGWLMLSRHPEVVKHEVTVDMSDLDADPLVMLQRNYYKPLIFFTCFLVPTTMPCYLWGEDIYVAFFVCNVLRGLITLHITFTVNSFAHIWGNKPYNKYIASVDNKWISALAIGEGWHNYHHTFPYDYKAGEFGWKVNLTTIFIDLCAAVGLAYDRKTAHVEAIKSRIQKTGADNGTVVVGHHARDAPSTDDTSKQRSLKTRDSHG